MLTLGLTPYTKCRPRPVVERGGRCKRRARDSRAPPVKGGADGCDARTLSA